MDKQEFEWYLNDLIKHGNLPEVQTEAMREYVQKMHNANERLELIEARLLGSLSYERDEYSKQMIVEYLGYDPRLLPPRAAPKFSKGQAVRVVGDELRRTWQVADVSDGPPHLYELVRLYNFPGHLYVTDDQLEAVGNE